MNVPLKEDNEPLFVHIQIWASLDERTEECDREELLSRLICRLAFLRTYLNKNDESVAGQFADAIAKQDLMPCLLNVLFDFSNSNDDIAEEVSWVMIGLFTAESDLLNHLCSESLFHAFDFMLKSTNPSILENVRLLAIVGNFQPSLQKPLCEEYSCPQRFL